MKKLIAIGDECEKIIWFRELDPASQEAFRRYGIWEEDL